MPKHTPHHSFRILREQAPLRRLVTAYSSGNRAAMASTLDKEGKWFADAGLTGLAQQLLAKVVTRKIQHLTATYRTLALADIAREAGLESAAAAQQHILKYAPGLCMQPSCACACPARALDRSSA